MKKALIVKTSSSKTKQIAEEWCNKQTLIKPKSKMVERIIARQAEQEEREEIEHHIREDSKRNSIQCKIKAGLTKSTRSNPLRYFPFMGKLDEKKN